MRCGRGLTPSRRVETRGDRVSACGDASAALEEIAARIDQWSYTNLCWAIHVRVVSKQSVTPSRGRRSDTLWGGDYLST